MSDLRLVADDAILAIQQASTDAEALAIEASLLQETDNGLRPGDPEAQPPTPDEPRGADPSGRASSDVDRVIGRFESQLGTTENPPHSNQTIYCDWYGFTGPWCAMFVSWCFFHEGIPLTASSSKGFASTPVGAHWFKNQGRWSATPERGHVVFFDFPDDNVHRISHVGIVTGVNQDGTIDTIEGNTDDRGGRTGGKVMRRRRAVGIVGYGVPPYRESDDGGGDGDGPPWDHPHGRYISAPHRDCETVRQWQERMAHLGRQIAVDADYGPQSEGVCRAFQRERGLEVDGVIGPKTWTASWD